MADSELNDETGMVPSGDHQDSSRSESDGPVRSPSLAGINIHQKHGLGSSGSQDVHITQNNIIQRGFENLARTHEGGITFDPESLRDVILAIDASAERAERNTDFVAIDIEIKNKLNGLTQEFYDETIAVDYEPYFSELDVFLKLRENKDLQIAIDSIVKNLNRKISAHRVKYNTFEELLLSIEDTLVDTEIDHLRGKESTVALFLFYLYSNCMIGRKTEGEKC